MEPIDVDELALQIRRGSVRALARGLTWIEAGGDRAEALGERLYSYGGRAQIVGITGAPGSGKSTLVRALVRAARPQGRTVAVIAVDPSSPFSGGSILGDRIRMNDLSSDPGVFIRSMATRGALGGLCRAAADAVDLVSAAGRDLVILETVGVGQDEVEIMRLAQTTVVVSVPGLGDDIQALKAGIIEIADVHVVNKADRDGANRTVQELRAVLALVNDDPQQWQPPIVTCVATREDGAAQLLHEVDRHFAHLQTNGEGDARERRIAESRVLKTAEALLARAITRPSATSDGAFTAEIDRVARRQLSPYGCARALLARAYDHTRSSSDVRP